MKEEQAALHLSASDVRQLCEVMATFHTTGDMDAMLAIIFEQLKCLLGIEGVSLALHDPLGREFFFIHAVKPSGEPQNAGDQVLRFPDRSGIAGWVMENGNPVLVNDVAEDARYYAGLDGKGQFSTRSMICMPLRTRKGFVGVLYALNKMVGLFTERDLHLLQILAGSIAVSLENARLYGELKSHCRRLERERQLLLHQMQGGYGFREIIGSSPPMRRMFDLMAKVIDTPTTVLIQGETGTGKELIAKVIHFNGPLKNKPFVAENCAALPEHLLESELFGHVKGAFTGAIAAKKGLFEVADGGTIFLDEIGEMALPMQAKLLRVLQEGQFRPVGSNQTRQTQVRIIASTNRDLLEEVRQRRFREDLYYRINVFQITSPSLRERKEDIPALADHFLAKHAEKNKRAAPHLAPQALNLLVRFDWPGNVRELENEMARAMAMTGGQPVVTEDLLSEKLRPQAKDGFSCLRNPEASLKEIVQDVEVRLIVQALQASGGNRSRAARVLGLSRQGLLNKIAAYRLATDLPAQG